MKPFHNRKSARPPARLPAYRPAFERLDTALAKYSQLNEDEKIQLARIALFGVEAVGALPPHEDSGTNIT
jgi:hypothetical protein